MPLTRALECTLTGLCHMATIAMTVFDHRGREAALVQIGRDLNDFSDNPKILQKVIDVAAEALKFEDCSLFLLDELSGKLCCGPREGH